MSIKKTQNKTKNRFTIVIDKSVLKYIYDMFYSLIFAVTKDASNKHPAPM